MELWRILKSPHLGKFLRQVKIWAEKFGTLLLLGSAESSTADFLLIWLKSSRSDPRRCVDSQTCRPQVIWRLRPLWFYGRRLSRTVPARPVKISAGVQNSCGRANFHHFLWKLKNSIAASRCPITAQKIRTWSLLLSKFSYPIHSLQKGGHPRLWARLPKPVYNPLGGEGGEGGGLSFSPLILITWPQAVRQMRNVGRGGGKVEGGGVGWYVADNSL